MLNGELYFIGSMNNLNALYKTDGTAGGTVAVTDQSVSDPSQLYTVGNKVFFLAATSTGQRLLFNGRHEHRYRAALTCFQLRECRRR